MTAVGPVIRRVPAALGTIASLLALALLFEARPAVSPVSGSLPSLSSPVNLELAREALGVAAWGAAIVVAALLLLRSLGALLAGSRRREPQVASVVAPSRPSLGQARLASGVAQARFPSPFPLVLRRRADRAVTPRQALVVALVQECATGTPAIRRERADPPLVDLPAQPQPSIAVLGALNVVPLERRGRNLRSDTQQLLAYLALHRDGATRDELVAALWPDVGFEKARKRLWRSISEARAQLGDIILRVDERYLLNRTQVTIDVDQFDSLLRQADAERGPDRLASLERALLLVRGRPLDGNDYPWAAGEIRRLTATIVDRLEGLGRCQLDASNPAEALAVAEKALVFDPHNEAVSRVAMQAESALGLRQAVADRYEQLWRELDARFGLEPERETRLVYRSLLSQDGPQPHRP